MSDPTGAVAAEATPAAETTTTSGPDLSPVYDRMDQLASGVGEMRSTFEQFVQSQQPQPEPEPDPWAALFGGEPEPNAAEFQPQPAFDPQALQAAMNQAIQQANAPLQAQLQQFQQQAAAQQLGQMIPQLANTPENAETIKATDTLVRQSIAHLPPQMQQTLLMDPTYISTVFKAAEAEKLAQGQAPAGGQVPTLEAAGGAHPGGNGEPVNPVHQAYGHTNALPQGFN